MYSILNPWGIGVKDFFLEIISFMLLQQVLLSEWCMYAPHRHNVYHGICISTCSSNKCYTSIHGIFYIPHGIYKTPIPSLYFPANVNSTLLFRHVS